MRKITGINDISSQDPIKQVWKYLRSFHDESTTINRIRRVNPFSDSKNNKNIKKQAEQISYCIYQAEEYYESAKHVTLATKPLLLYYGSIALSQAVILFANDGTSSFDSLRKNNKKWGHGLNSKFKNFPRNVKDMPLTDILSTIGAEIRRDEMGETFGQFGAFYKSIIPSAIIIPLKEVAKSITFDRKIPQNTIDLTPIEKIRNELLTCLNLSLNLPDLFNHFHDIKVRPNLCQTRPSMERHIYYEDSKVSKITDKHNFIIDAISNAEKKIFLDHLTLKESDFKTKLNIPNHLILTHTLNYMPNDKIKGYYPDLADNISGDIFIVVNPEKAFEETATLYMLQYCLGTLCRYSPDIWMRLISGSVVFREFIDSLLQIIERKFPNLILDQLTEIKHHIHL
ncbi:MAG: hypothetical protein KAS13_02325 [Candidatus Omnitrophica bacterium]|nr:hypothetical protein [Candidatus Omnitrophota bacterium]